MLTYVIALFAVVYVAAVLGVATFYAVRAAIADRVESRRLKRVGALLERRIAERERRELRVVRDENDPRGAA